MVTMQNKAKACLKKLTVFVVVMFFFSLVALGSLGGCASGRNTGRGALFGGLGGAAAGAGIGGVACGAKCAGLGALIGAGTGLVVGTVTGSVLDQQAEDFKQAGIEAERTDAGVLLLRLSENHLRFDFNSSDIKSEYFATLGKIATILKEYHQNRVRIVGHTDNVGGTYYNIVLSQKRAAAVAGYFYGAGVSAFVIKAVEGRGESQPIESNESEYGRSLNRRVEMFIEASPQN
jgi:outer membrane protein OmpA-like peptidoglycan-associated protein